MSAERGEYIERTPQETDLIDEVHYRAQTIQLLLQELYPQTEEQLFDESYGGWNYVMFHLKRMQFVHPYTEEERIAYGLLSNTPQKKRAK